LGTPLDSAYNSAVSERRTAEEQMTTAPLPLSSAGADAAHLLEYHTPAERPTGLHVERAEAGLSISLYPPGLVRDVKRAVLNALVWGTCASVLFWPPILLIELHSVSAAAAAFAIILLVNLPLETVLGILVMLAFRAEVRVEVTAAAVVVTVRGFRLYYQDTFRRADIVGVHSSLFGLRIDCRGRRCGDWVPGGMPAERKQVCLLLREELGL
jgi:hypothetical protein